MPAYAYYPGCSLSGLGKPYDESLRAVFGYLGLGLEEIPDWNCCGATAAHNLDHDLALALPARILAAAEKDGMDEVLVPCAACYSRLSVTRHELLEDEALRQRISGLIEAEYRGTARVINIIEWLSAIPGLEKAVTQQENGLSVLLGRNPGPIPRGKNIDQLILPAVVAGLPSDLLERRPDIRQAEAAVHAATARIGVAEADLFPRFTITGSIGVRSSDFGSWLDWSSRLWSIGPGVTWRVFDMGRVRSDIAQQEALQEQSLIAFQKTVLTALQEVEAALILLDKEQEQRKALVDAVAFNRKAVDLSIRLYTEGQTDFLNVLQAQRSLFVTEEALAQSTRTISTNLVALYKALGGGWDIQEVEQNETLTD